MDNQTKIFSYNIDIKKNAYLNWRTNPNEKGYNIYVIAQGYARATNILLESILNDNIDKKADILIFPILYDINQTIELYEKSIFVILKDIVKEEYTISKSHDIKQHFNIMVASITKYESTTKGLEKRLEILENYIDELYNYIYVNNKIEMDFSRYPIKPNGDNYFYIDAKESVVIDIQNLITIFNQIIDILDGLALKYFNELENII